MTWPIAQIIGPLAGTQIIGNYGYTPLLYALGGSALVAMLGFYLLGKAMEAES
jgi:hypothetical protein